MLFEIEFKRQFFSGFLNQLLKKNCNLDFLMFVGYGFILSNQLRRKPHGLLLNPIMGQLGLK